MCFIQLVRRRPEPGKTVPDPARGLRRSTLHHDDGCVYLAGNCNGQRYLQCTAVPPVHAMGMMARSHLLLLCIFALLLGPSLADANTAPGRLDAVSALDEKAMEPDLELEGTVPALELEDLVVGGHHPIKLAEWRRAYYHFWDVPTR